MKQVYISSPFRGDYKNNIHKAVEYCRIATNLGVLPLAPHIIFSQWCDDSIPEQREQGLKLGISLLRKSDELWVMGKEISTGMKDEIAYANKHDIPTFSILYPNNIHEYPVSNDGNTLLQANACIPGSIKTDLTGRLVILQYTSLSLEHRKPCNQLWIATHGPGCRLGSISDTVHLLHPIDGDRICVARHELHGEANPETIEKLKEQYPLFSLALSGEQVNDKDEGYFR